MFYFVFSILYILSLLWQKVKHRNVLTMDGWRRQKYGRMADDTSKVREMSNNDLDNIIGHASKQDRKFWPQHDSCKYHQASKILQTIWEQGSTGYQKWAIFMTHI